MMAGEKLSRFTHAAVVRSRLTAIMEKCLTRTFARKIYGFSKTKVRLSEKLLTPCSTTFTKQGANAMLGDRDSGRRQSLTLATTWGSPYPFQKDPYCSTKGLKLGNCTPRRNSSSFTSEAMASKCPFHGLIAGKPRKSSFSSRTDFKTKHAVSSIESRRIHSVSTYHTSTVVENVVPELWGKVLKTAEDLLKKFKLNVIDRFRSTTKPIASNSYFNIPGPKGLPLLGSVLDYTVVGPYDPKEFHKALESRHGKYGKIFREKLLSEEFVYTSDPKDLEILAHNEDAAPCRPHNDAIVESRKQEGFPVGITALQDEEWKRLRNAINPALMQPKVIRKHRPAQEEVARDFVRFIQNKRCPSTGEVENFETWLTNWALESVAVVLLDTRLGLISHDGEKRTDPLADRLRKAMDIFFDYGARLTFSAPVWKIYHTKEWKTFRKAQRDEFEAAGYFVDKKLRTIEKDCADTVPIANESKSRQRLKPTSSFLEHIVKNTDLERNESLTLCLELLAGGIDTSSNAVTFALYELSQNQECQETLRSLIRKDSENGIEGSNSESARYLRACVMESLRLHPLTFANMRRTKKDLSLSGYRIPAGTTVRFTNHLMHLRNEEYFPDPDSFIPDRWISKDSPHRCTQQFVFTPFGHGARQCPGRRIAEQELDLLFREILLHFRVEYHHEPMGTKVRLFNCADRASKFSFIPINQD